jgi:hypothetical protein
MSWRFAVHGSQFAVVPEGLLRIVLDGCRFGPSSEATTNGEQ